MVPPARPVALSTCPGDGAVHGGDPAVGCGSVRITARERVSRELFADLSDPLLAVQTWRCFDRREHAANPVFAHPALVLMRSCQLQTWMGAIYL